MEMTGCEERKILFRTRESGANSDVIHGCGQEVPDRPKSEDGIKSSPMYGRTRFSRVGSKVPEKETVL